MSVTAAKGILSFGPQVAKGTLATVWHRHRALAIDLDAIDETREGPAEVGGLPVPTFPYKAGPLVGGGATIQPRLKDSLGWLLYGMMGDVTTAADDYAASAYKHTFHFLENYEDYNPWMSFRKFIPAVDATPGTEFGQIFKDCKIIGGTIVLPNDAPLSMRVDVLGREFVLADPAAWTYAHDFEHWESIPIGCLTGGYIKVDGVEFPVVQATVGFQNVPLDIRQERVFGSPWLQDITTIQRRLVYDMTVKYEDPELYRSILTGSISGTEWSGSPTLSSLAIKTISSENMPGETDPYALEIDADEIMLNQVGGITLAANQSILMRFQGVALEATNYGSFTLTNQETGYTWPV